MIWKTKLANLNQDINGELYCDNLTQALYATDASVYRELPLAVALPKNNNDVKALIKFANINNVSLIPRAAGTSLGGQCVGKGIVVDCSKYFTNIIEINTRDKWVKVQPGVIRDELNEALKPYGLYFGPNTSTANRCMMGGMLGNNSCGSSSIIYGDTRSHTLEVHAFLSDGSDVVFKQLSKEEFSDKLKLDTLEGQLYRHIFDELSNTKTTQEIIENYPDHSVTRRNTGYAVDALLNSQIFSETSRKFNFCNLIAGSEGTLAFVTEIKLKVVDLPKPCQVIVAAHFKSIQESLKATVLAMQHKPTACELMDKTILDCTKDNLLQKRNRFFVEGDPQAILMIEFRDESYKKTLLKANKLIATLQKETKGFAFPIITGNKTKSVWDLRKAGLGLLANIPGDKKALACIEDTAVALNKLPSYIEEFSKMMKSFGQDAVYYAHAGAGELHLRPILNLKKSEDVKLFREISEASAKLVTKYGGSLSGEHGDGRVRAEFIAINLGENVYQLLRRIKYTWDPKNIFNPNKIVDPAKMDSNLRYEANKPTKHIETLFNFSETGGLIRTVEKCNGSGDCRKLNLSGGTMCPSYRATKDEKDSTRGRSNILREFLTQNTKENPFNHPEIAQAMELCISCKGCKSECPSNIDMATLKAEFQFQYYKNNSPSIRTRLIANSAKLNKQFYRFAPISNWLLNLWVVKSFLGIARQRSLPKIQQQTFRNWLINYTQPKSEKKVHLFIDEYTNFYDVTIGQKTVKLLNTLGYEVLFTIHPESARAYISKGFIKHAKSIATENIRIFKNRVSKEIPLIGIEPSAILGFRDEYINLVDSEIKPIAQKLSEHVYLVDEFLAHQFQEGSIQAQQFTEESRTILLHGHCHQKALSSMDYTTEILSAPLNYHVEVIPSGCCGMAGAFGFESEHFELSNAIGNLVLFPAIQNEKKKTTIAATGTSCRHQIKDATQKNALHPIEILYEALK